MLCPHLNLAHKVGSQFAPSGLEAIGCLQTLDFVLKYKCDFQETGAMTHERIGIIKW